MSESHKEGEKVKSVNALERDFPDPVSYMRQRHPDLYSDSSSTSNPVLTQNLLEYHLDTITNRNQEAEFAYFARRLAEKELCPNLRPQTGPVGGGDSKVDSETIPVSSELAALWVGSDPKAAEERWAFAFSAKEKWKDKVAEDVRKIAGTGRGYSRIYFITSQFAPDKSRANSEDALSAETGIQITILDRSWIVKAVIEHGRAEIAIDALKIEELRSHIEKKVGPADLERLSELETLEASIADPERYRGARYQLIEDALRAALLARGLGRPRTEVEGLFIRAERLASSPDQPRQRLRIAYNYAWTVVFWFNDVRLLSALYDTVESYALKSDQMEEVELAQNLWMVLLSGVRRGMIGAPEARLEARRTSLLSTMQRLAADATRPNNGLQARTGLAIFDMQAAIETGDSSQLDTVWVTFRQIVTDSRQLGDYPFERLAKIIMELGDTAPESQTFDGLFEEVVESLEKRRGERAGAGLLVERGRQKLKSGKHYEAISLLGRALDRYSQREHRVELIGCLTSLSDAYTRAGLDWAARCCALSVTERCFAFFREDGTLFPPSLSAVNGLVTAELKLGRIPHLLMGMELEDVLATQLALSDERRGDQLEHRRMTEGMLGISFLSSSIEQLRHMAAIPESLEAMDLVIPKALLLYALGYRDELRSEGFTAESFPDEALDEFMKTALGQPGRLQMPEHPQVDVDGAVEYCTTVLGCQIQVKAPATIGSISVAEAVLGAIEAFFATSLDERILPYRANAEIRIQPSTDLTMGLTVALLDAEEGSGLRVLHPAVPAPYTAEARRAYRDGLMHLIPTFISHVAVVDNLEAYFERIAGEERGFARALLYAEVSLSQENVFGASPKVLLADWAAAPPARHYPLRRSRPWFEELDIKQTPLATDESAPEFDPADPAGSFRRQAANGKHSARRVSSLIDVPAWDAARWRAVFFLYNPAVYRLPILGLGFDNKDAAEQIFLGWRKELGESDSKNSLRILIARGISRSNPAHYRVMISTNIDPTQAPGSIMVMVVRRQTMEPKTTENLDSFLRSFARTGEYLLAPAHFVSKAKLPDVGLGLGVRKVELVVRNAWEIPLHDPDAAVIGAEDDPVIPPDVANAPVLEVLSAVRARRAKR